MDEAKSPGHLRLIALIALLLLALGVAAWVWLPKLRFRSAPVTHFDRAADRLPLPAPVSTHQATLRGAPKLPESAGQTLSHRRAFFSGDFARLHDVLQKGHDDYVSGRADSNQGELVLGIAETQLAGIDRCGQWLREMPSSYPAHWQCAAIWEAGANAARGTGYASTITPDRFRLMHERLARANALLTRALTLTGKPVEALTMLGANHYFGGDAEQGEMFLQRAEALMPAHPPIHRVRAHYAQPEWGGADEAVADALARAKAARVKQDELLDMHDDFVAQPRRMSTPGAGRAYWRNAIRVRPTPKRLRGLAADLMGTQAWADALPVVDQLIAARPGDHDAYQLRARTNEHIGRIPQAHDDYLMAAALGNNLALQKIVMAHIAGGLGLPGKSYNSVIELCEYGVALGLSVAANCLGAMHFEAPSYGVKFKTDPLQGYAWHQFGARGGHYNSQFDLGWMLYTGRVPGVDSEVANRTGIFWLRRAAEQDHMFAKRKLEELGVPPSEEDSGGVFENLLAMVIALFERYR